MLKQQAANRTNIPPTYKQIKGMINKPVAIFTHHTRKVYPQVWHAVLSLPFFFFLILKEFITQRISQYETSQGIVCSMPAAIHLTNIKRKNVYPDSNIHSIALQQPFFLVGYWILSSACNKTQLTTVEKRQAAT